MRTFQLAMRSLLLLLSVSLGVQLIILKALSTAPKAKSIPSTNVSEWVLVSQRNGTATVNPSVQRPRALSYVITSRDSNSPGIRTAGRPGTSIPLLLTTF